MSPSREVYPHGHHPSVLRSHGWRTAANSAAYLLPFLRPTDRLLDVGVGPGSITVDLARRLEAGRVTGIDNAADAVTATRRLAAESGVEGLTVTEGDVYALGFADESFEVVHAHQVLQHLADPVAALAEMRRVCVPDGIVATRDADYAAMTWFPEDPRLDRWLDLTHQLGRAGGGEPDAGRRLKTWTRQAGFAVVWSGASAWCFSTPDEVGWWSDTWADRLTQSGYAELAVEQGLADAADLAELAAGWREWATAPDAWFAVLHAEILASPAGPARFQP